MGIASDFLFLFFFYKEIFPETTNTKQLEMFDLSKEGLGGWAWTPLWKPLSYRMCLILNPSGSWVLPLEKYFHPEFIFSFASFGFLNNFLVLK